MSAAAGEARRRTARSRNGVTPGGTIVLNTTSAPLAMIRSTVSRVVGVVEREVLLADDLAAVRRDDLADPAFITCGQM